MSDVTCEDPRPVIGIDLGASQVRAALVDRRGHLLARAACATDAVGGPGAVIQQMQSLVAEVTSSLPPAPLHEQVAGVGVCSPGPLDAQAGVVACIPTLAGWIDVPLVAQLSSALGLPVRLDNDAIGAAVGEWHFGAGQGLTDFVYMTVSTGIGGGVIADGHVLRGRRSMAAHIGHMNTAPHGAVCSCGNQGCWEAQASGTALGLRGRTLAAQRPDSVLHALGPHFGAREIVEAARQGDSLALELMAEEARQLGIGIVSLLHLFSPQLIVMGGGVSQAFDLLREGIQREIAQRAMPPFRDVPVVTAALGENAGLVGAASLVMRS